MRVKLTKEQKVKILNSNDVYTIMKQVLLRESKIDRNKEHMWVVCLASNNSIILIELISLGTLNRTVVEPVDVFSFALQKQSAKLVLVHNHPSGELVPTDDDIDFTDLMLQNSLFLKVPIIDHLIISEEDYYSFMDSGLLAELHKSEKYVPPYVLYDRKVKEEGEKAGLKKGRKAEKLEIARKMKEEGMPVDAICNFTGLTKKEIDKL